jgi:methylenetetrahydrofolate dehydrogenase (NADP+)/methenyltetrahydrofolate cyclohydrolase
MSAQIINGKDISLSFQEGIRRKVDILRDNGVIPGLAVILAGDDPASRIYVHNKEKACEAVGIYSVTHRFNDTVSYGQIAECIHALNDDCSIHGILVQLPLPRHIDEASILALIKPEKDVDGFHVQNAGSLYRGTPSLVPCTPLGVMEMLKAIGYIIAGREAVVVGRSNVVGKPMAMLLLNNDATVTICHAHTADLKANTIRADILVTAVGKPCLITADMVKPGAVVIDVGINRLGDKIVGDVDFSAVKEVAGWITPVPGGVGRMTITMLLDNTVKAAKAAG